jgi:hypothetical protein
MASLEYLEANGMEKAPHPPYSPDLAPSDFFLFGCVKRMLCGCAFGSSGELLPAVGGILAGIDESILINVSHEWRKRLQKYIDIEGEYIKWFKRLIQVTFIFVRGIVRC